MCRPTCCEYSGGCDPRILPVQILYEVIDSHEHGPEEEEARLSPGGQW